MQLNEIHSVKATQEQDVYELTCNITDVTGSVYDATYLSRPDDCYGLNPIIRKWLIENFNVAIEPYVSPTLDQTRASMPPLTARQLRLGLLGRGISLNQVAAAIDAMPETADKDRVQIEWEYATTFDRVHPIIATIGAAAGLTDEQIDVMWEGAVSL